MFALRLGMHAVDFLYLQIALGPTWKVAYGGFPKIRCTFLGGPYSKDYGLLGTTWGVPLFGESTIYGSQATLFARQSVLDLIFCKKAAPFPTSLASEAVLLHF